MRIRDPGWRQFGSGMEKSRIRDKHPGSATLHGGHKLWRPNSIFNLCLEQKKVKLLPPLEYVSIFSQQFISFMYSHYWDIPVTVNNSVKFRSKIDKIRNPRCRTPQQGDIKPLFRIRDILVRIRIVGSVRHLWLTDPDADPYQNLQRLLGCKIFFSSSYFLMV